MDQNGKSEHTLGRYLRRLASSKQHWLIRSISCATYTPKINSNPYSKWIKYAQSVCMSQSKHSFEWKLRIGFLRKMVQQMQLRMIYKMVLFAQKS